MENETSREILESIVDKTETQPQERKTKKKRIDVAEVLKAIKAGTGLKELANRFNVSYCAFYNYKELKEALQTRKNAKKGAILQQIEILTSQGLNNKEIAAKLDISLVTLRKYSGGKKAKKVKAEVTEKEMDEITPTESTRSMIPAPAKPEVEQEDGSNNK